MTYCLILAEKKSVAQAISVALLGSPNAFRGQYKGEDIVISWAQGHLFEYRDPQDMVPAEKHAKYASWNFFDWDPKDFSFAVRPTPKTATVTQKLRSELAGASEVAWATDHDPSGEGDRIAATALKELGYEKKVKHSRLFFLDESADEFRKAFENRKPLPNDFMQIPAVRKAIYRARFDTFTMPYTRMATTLNGQRVQLRQGRLKSIMVQEVGDRLEARKNWKKVPSYIPSFKDEEGNIYRSKDAPAFETELEAVTYMTDENFGQRKVLPQEPTTKTKAPPKLLTLSQLSAQLAKKGYSPKKVDSVYQAMYQASIVTYPRTDDDFISPAQFDDLLKDLNKIAAVIGADTSLLTHTTPRKGHVKTGGAHGANRPGKVVPESLEQLRSFYGSDGNLAVDIYTLLAKSALTMFGEDAVYRQHKGVIEGKEDYTTTVSTLINPGYKAIFDAQAGGEDADEDSTTAKLGTMANGHSYESIPPKPGIPTMGWLMDRLKKLGVGTGATQNKTFGDLSVAADERSYFVMNKDGHLSFTPSGEMSYRMMADTHIASVETTRYVTDTMAKIAEGTMSFEEGLAPLRQWILEDQARLIENASSMKTMMGLVDQRVEEYAYGFFQGQDVKFRRGFGKVKRDGKVIPLRFTDKEVEALIKGEKIVIEQYSSKSDTNYKIEGQLAYQEISEGKFKGKTYLGFQRLGFYNDPNDQPKVDEYTGKYLGPGQYQGTVQSVPKVFLGVKLSDNELSQLFAGGTIYKAFFSKKTGKPFVASVTVGETEQYKTKEIVFGYRMGFDVDKDTKVKLLADYKKSQK